jgi:hypothetical protein
MKNVAKARVAAVCIAAGVMLYIDFASKEAGTATGDAGATNAAAKVDFDLTRMNATMRATYTYRLGANPSEFEGKTLRLSGVLLTRIDESEGERRFACMMGNPEGCACCAPGGVLEFEPKSSYKWPEDFPPLETVVTVQGRLAMFEVGDCALRQPTYQIPRLVDADIFPR